MAKPTNNMPNPEDYIGNEYIIYNKPVLARFQTSFVKVRVEQYWRGIDTFRLSVVIPREHDGEFIMCPTRAIIESDDL